MINQRLTLWSAGCVGRARSVRRAAASRQPRATAVWRLPSRSYISTVRVTHRTVKNWSSGDMRLRWTAAGVLEAEIRSRKVQG
jgi:hypothetical protein